MKQPWENKMCIIWDNYYRVYPIKYEKENHELLQDGK